MSRQATLSSFFISKSARNEESGDPCKESNPTIFSHNASSTEKDGKMSLLKTDQSAKHVLDEDSDDEGVPLNHLKDGPSTKTAYKRIKQVTSNTSEKKKECRVENVKPITEIQQVDNHNRNQAIDTVTSSMEIEKGTSKMKEKGETEKQTDKKDSTIEKHSKVSSYQQELDFARTKVELKSGTCPDGASIETHKKISSSDPETILSTLPIDDAHVKDCWKSNEPAPYSVLCQTFSAIEAITSRLEIQKLLTILFRVCLERSHKDLLYIVYLASNEVAAAYECVELGVGDAILVKAIGEASGTNPAIIKSKYEAEGDLGNVAMNAKGKQKTLGFGAKPKPLTVQEVLTVFRQIATTSGNQSQKWKVDKIKGLLVRAQEGQEAKYIIRGLQGKLRIGLAQSTVLISLAHAILLSPPTTSKGRAEEEKITIVSEDAKIVMNSKLPVEARLDAAVNIVKKAYSEVPSYDALVEALLTVPLDRLHEVCTLRPGLPVEPMLAKPTKSVQEVLQRLSGKRFTCEFKYDGERAQVHMTEDGATKVFSRNLLDTSEKYPEVSVYVKEACGLKSVTSFVLDAEVVAYNRETKQFVPFQVLSTRKKLEESEENVKVKIIVQAFDLMYLNGESLLSQTLSERRRLLLENFVPVEGKFQFAASLDHTEDGDTTVLEEFLETAVKNQCEGLMIKTLDDNATYQPSVRSLNWLKLKKDYLDGMGDSVDLVPLGAYYGRGKRTGVYGAYLLACYDIDTEEFQSVCKIGTGFSDDDLKQLTDSFKDHILPCKSSQYIVSDTLECDVWFDACQVWEIKAADLSKSSTHKGAIEKTGESGRGIGLRFPRFERVREDKKPDQATTSDQILEMYYAQDSIVNNGDGNNDDDGI